MAEENQLTCWDIEPSAFPTDGSLPKRLEFLLRFAILAPSSHNTEPWKFRVCDNRVHMLVDDSRWLRVADSDQRELYLSIGCALENLLVAAEHFGLAHETHYCPDPDQALLATTVIFHEDGERSGCRPENLFDMIQVRHTNHGKYEDRPIPQEILQQLQALCREDGLVLHLIDDSENKRQVDKLVIRGDAIQFSDPAFREELAYWIGQGVFGTSWLMSKIGKLAVSHINMGNSRGKQDSEVLMSSPVLGVISTKAETRRLQIKVGQLYQRFSLLAARQGIWCQPMSQIVEVPELKVELAALLPVEGLIPQHPFRIGYADAESQHTPRRPLEDVLL